jgi:hypothetical protein
MNGSNSALAGFLLLLCSASAVPEPSKAGSKEAYVSLLYGDAFLTGMRVLGRSLRETGTRRWVGNRKKVSGVLSAATLLSSTA